MTEQEWLTSVDPAAMLRFITRDGSGPGDGPNRRVIASDRKLRLFSCTSANLCTCGEGKSRNAEEYDAADAVFWAERVTIKNCLCTREVRAALLRDIFGNPYRPVLDTLPGYEEYAYERIVVPWLTWHDGIVVKLAQAAYDERGRWECVRCGSVGESAIYGAEGGGGFALF